MQLRVMKREKISNLDEQLVELSKIISDQSALIALEQGKVTALQSANQTQNTTIQDLQNVLNQQILENNALIEDDTLDEAEKEALKKQIQDLEGVNAGLLSSNTSQNTVIDQLQAELITVDANCPVNVVNATQNAISIMNSKFSNFSS